MKPSPERATLERQGKRKAEADGKRNKTSGGGGGQKRLNQPDTAKTYNNLSTQRAKPTWREENARTHEIGTHGELVKTWCIHNACKIRDKAQRPSAFKSQPSGRLTCSTPELGEQLNLTNDQKKEKGTIPASMSFCLIMWACRTCGQSLEQHSKKVLS